MKSAMRMPIAKPFASGERPGGTDTNRVSQSSSFMVRSEFRVQYANIAAVNRLNNPSCGHEWWCSQDEQDGDKGLWSDRSRWGP